MILEVVKSKIKPLDERAMGLAQKRLDSLTKPLGSNFSGLGGSYRTLIAF